MRTQRHAPSISILLSSACTLLACLWTLLAPATSWAEDPDNKSYPATSCRKVNTSGGILGVRDDGTVQNDSSSATLTVICPIVRDNTQNTDAFDIIAHVIDSSGAHTLSCTTTSVSTFGSPIDPDADNTGAVGFTGFDELFMAPTSQGVEGYSTLRCTLPPGSQLISYTVFEPDGGGATSDQKSYTATYAERSLNTAGAAASVTYQDLGKATPSNANADDSWILPTVRDSTTSKFDRLRFRFNDADGDLGVECWAFAWNEDGTLAGSGVHGGQVGSPNATVTVLDTVVIGLGSGPLALWCEGIAVDVTATMYDVRED